MVVRDMMNGLLFHGFKMVVGINYKPLLILNELFWLTRTRILVRNSTLYQAILLFHVVMINQIIWIHFFDPIKPDPNSPILVWFGSGSICVNIK